MQAAHNVRGCMRTEEKCCRSPEQGLRLFPEDMGTETRELQADRGAGGQRTAELFARIRAQESNVDGAPVGREGKLSDRGGKTKASESTASLVGPAADGRESGLSREADGAQPPTNTQLPAEGPARLDRA